ncbi:MAG TPA: helicase HerA-like domain-containing protein, partial [Anaerolineales bacterium]|nr:helicase HerA-like domain-containing protein [Anaerolineales bacterium]
MAVNPISPLHTISIADIDYLLRSDLPLPAPDLAALTPPPPDLCRLWRVDSVGVVEKQQALRENESRTRPRLPSEDLLTSLYGANIRLAFLVRGTPQGVQIHLGSWAPEGAPESPDGRQEVVRAALRSLYPAVSISPAVIDLPSFPASGMALGIPTVKRPEPTDGALGLDRLIRAMFAGDWYCLILAEPVSAVEISGVRRAVVAELRVVQAAAKAGSAPVPLLEHYNDLLKAALLNHSTGQAVGAWRTGVYLGGDLASYRRLVGLWRGIFSGDDSIPEPLQVWDLPEAASLAQRWVQPNEAPLPGPGNFRHPYQYQTLLNSQQLSAYIHLPCLETSGFIVQAVPDFDASSPISGGAQGDVAGGVEGTIELGKVILRGQQTANPYVLRLKDLTRHAFIAGVTGSGKTNTIKTLLQQVVSAGVPFLVIEPAKAEYRRLLNLPTLRDRLHVFTLGNEPVAPLRLNPFEVVGWPENSVGVHLDLLRSVFIASFGMWTPLPQILEQCLYGIYTDRGWDILGNQNPRLTGEPDLALAFPTLSELAAKVEEVIGRLGYDEEITSRMRAALLTRLNSLRTGGKGAMLDVQRSLPIEDLLESPSVLELEGMGDDDDKAFIIGLLFIRLVEFRRAEEKRRNAPREQGLKHLLVIEEAHRLLTAVGERREEEGNPRGKAVETFANLLAEIRAYGQGVLVADQVPVKLAPEVIKNTNLKIAHRVVAAEDRAALAGAMAMNERQAHSLATLTLGQAAVFSEGDDAPVLVKMEAAEGDGDHPAPNDAQVAAASARQRLLEADPSLFHPLQVEVRIAGGDQSTWEAARGIAATPAFQRTLARLVLTMIENPQALDRLWPELQAQVQALRQSGMDESALLGCASAYGAADFALRRGSQAGWSFAAIQVLADRLRDLLVAKSRATAAAVEIEILGEAFRDYALQLHQRSFDPFPACSQICWQQPLRCLYRYAAADLIVQGDQGQGWKAAAAALLAGTEGGPRQAW